MIAAVLRRLGWVRPTDAQALDAPSAEPISNHIASFESLRIDPTRQVRRLVLYGGCFAEGLVAAGRVVGHPTDHLLYLSGLHEDPPPPSGGQYEAAVIVLSLRTVLGQVAEQLLGFHDADLIYQKEIPPATVLATARVLLDSLTEKFENRLHGLLPVFFLAFVEPPATASGLLHARAVGGIYRLVRDLNDHLAARLSGARGAWYIEVNDLLRGFGDTRWYDGFDLCFAHAGLRPPEGGQESDSPHAAILRRIDRALSVLQPRQPVKLIVTDLDGTLWKGVLAEEDSLVPGDHTEGWPIGYAEALLECKRRGILLAICSKNDEDATRRNFDRVWYGRIRLDDFCTLRINWRPKSENLREIRHEVNVLPENALFIDDNPLEIAEVTRAFPELRVLTGEPQHWRMELLYGVPFQVTQATAESARRTQLIQAKIVRDQALTQASTDREGYLRSLELRAEFFCVTGPDHRHFARALELLNKTNQFNTTGRRWTGEELMSLLSQGGQLQAMRAVDRLADHGLIGLALVQPGQLVQLVLSCRVFGLALEDALLHHVASDAAPQGITAVWHATEKNATARQFIQRHFSLVDSVWRLNQRPPWPEHIERSA